MLCGWHRKLELRRWAAEHISLPSANAPDDWPAAASIKTGGLLPLRHGQHAMGQSAIYAGVNAVRLASVAHHRWTRRDNEQVLGMAWAWREARGQGSPQRGMRRSDFARMLEALSCASRRLHDQFVTVSKVWPVHPPGRSDFFTTIERSIVAQDVVVILIAGAQYSVVRGFTPDSLLLFDSGGRRWIRRASITLTDTHQPARHALATRATLMVRRGC